MISQVILVSHELIAEPFFINISEITSKFLCGCNYLSMQWIKLPLKLECITYFPWIQLHSHDLTPMIVNFDLKEFVSAWQAFSCIFYVTCPSSSEVLMMWLRRMNEGYCGVWCLFVLNYKNQVMIKVVWKIRWYAMSSIKVGSDFTNMD